eukprot:1143940-Pelagomonas_calceolata.AAC.2
MSKSCALSFAPPRNAGCAQAEAVPSLSFVNAGAAPSVSFVNAGNVGCALAGAMPLLSNCRCWECRVCTGWSCAFSVNFVNAGSARNAQVGAVPSV